MNHKRRELPETAKIVNGSPIFTKSENFTLYPFFFNIPTPTTLQLAPIGVILPPIELPIKRPKRKRYGFNERLEHSIFIPEIIAIV